ncbi:hypothetical protein BC938DRAFT_472152 [Jimgerdemannia flammicorona]|uniref:JmjC domain-containing protein n=1 Tax=Jimgerdemannia flammicorona TaxID=994334 RepID=A0A433QU84_9FUNG|nr:hypothetical protein BC938DRAFT_472152 [Jimgerdemannia flammicorona]
MSFIDPNCDHITSIPCLATPPSYHEFLHNYLIPNVPVLIGPALTTGWRARCDWVRPNPDCHGEEAISEKIPRFVPDFAFLMDRFGDAPVQVADCRRREFTDQPRVGMMFADFVEKWGTSVVESEGEMKNDQVRDIEAKWEHDSDRTRYYLKDWHFVKAFPEYGAYETPDIFRDDWMNEFWHTRNDVRDDYRFVYMGGHGTFTPFHADVYRSYSWSANICGIKRWTLFHPGQEHLFKDKLGNMVYDVRDVDPARFSRFAEARRIVLLQRDGETLFVPSGWFHQVENIGSTISINHNWSNACNLPYLHTSFVADLGEVRYALRDLIDLLPSPEFERECQRLLLVNSGWDWIVLWRMCACIMQRLRRQLEGEDGDKGTPMELQPPVGFQAKRILDVMMGLLAETEAGKVVGKWYEEEGGMEVGTGEEAVEEMVRELKGLVEEYE